MKKQLANKKFNLDNLLKIYIFIALFSSSGSFISTSNTSLVFGLSISASFIMLLHYRYMSRNSIKLIGFVILMFLINIIFSGNAKMLGSYVRLFVVILLAILVVTFFRVDEFILWYVRIMAVTTVIAIVVYVLINIWGISGWLNALPISTNSNNVSAYNGGLFIVYTYSTKRLTSFFWEPAVYSTYALLGIIFELYLKKETSILNLVIFTLGIILSQSTGGIILLAYILAFFFILKTKKTSSRVILVTLLSMIVIVLYINYESILSFFIDVAPDIFLKLDPTQKKDTLIDRSNAGRINMMIFNQHPFFGVGLSTVEVYFSKLGGGAETSTITYFMAAFGLFGIFYPLTYVYAFLKQKYMSLIAKIFFIVFFTILLSKEPYTFQTGIYAFWGLFLKQNIELNSMRTEKLEDYKQ